MMMTREDRTMTGLNGRKEPQKGREEERGEKTARDSRRPSMRNAVIFFP
jgi:hypothetical protein